MRRGSSSDSLGSAVSARSAASDRKEKKEKKHKKDKREKSPDPQGALGLGRLQASPPVNPAGSLRSLKPMGGPLPLSRQGSAESLASHLSDRSQAGAKKKDKKEKKA